MPLALTDETKERIFKLMDVGRVTLQFGWIPFIVYVGWANSSPRPSLVHMLSMEVAAGLSAGACSTILTHPLDVLKIRQQLGATSPLAIWRGISPNLIGNTVAWGAYYGLYAQLQELCVQHGITGPAKFWTSSFLAGATTSFATNPIWVLKTRMVGSTLKPYKTMASSIAHIFRNDGITGFWRGYPLSLMGTVQASIHFMVYDSLKDKILEEWTPSARYLVASALSKTFSATLLYPHQLVRSRMQYTNTKFSTTVKQTWREFGVRGFYRGLWPALLRVVPSMCITQLTYEYLVNLRK